MPRLNSDGEKRSCGRPASTPQAATPETGPVNTVLVAFALLFLLKFFPFKKDAFLNA